MKKNKDLFDQIRENQHKLNERPSAQSWRKLERKLDRRRRGNNLLVVRAMSMAAAMIILVGVIYVFSNTVTDNAAQNSPTAELAPATIDSSPMEMEELTYPEKTVKPYRVLVQYQEKMPSRGVNPKPVINEGKGKKLVVLNGKKVDKLPEIERKDSLRKDSVKI